MNQLTDQAQNIQRLRYEAFAKLAAGVNKCDNFAEIAAVLTGQLKFILDTYIFKIYYQYESTAVSFRVFRGACTYREGTAVLISPLEASALSKGLPMSLQANCIDKPHDEIFTNPQVQQAAILPATGNRYEMVLTNATRKNSAVPESDFRFMRQISELVGNKLAQLMLIKQIENKTRQLEQKNEEITILNRTLEEKVLERTEALNQANTELQTLFYSATHDLRTPITNILGLSSLAGLYTADPDLLFLFEGCKGAATSLDKLLRKLNSLSSSGLQYELETTTGADLTELAKQRLTREIKDRNPVIRVGGDYSAAFRSRKNMLVYIFENLLENSIIFCLGQPVIDIHFTRSGKSLEIIFTDNGIGIATEISSQVFDMFYRGNELSTGSGLGLYVVKKLLKNLDGAVACKHSPTGGTIFTITLSNIDFVQKESSQKATGLKKTPAMLA